MRTPTGPTDAGVTVPPSGQRRDVRWSSSSRRSPRRGSWSRRSWSWRSSSPVPRVRWAGSRGRRVPVSMLRSGCSPRHGRSGPRPHATSLAATGHADTRWRAWARPISPNHRASDDAPFPAAEVRVPGRVPPRSVAGWCVGFSVVGVRDLGRESPRRVAGWCVGFSAAEVRNPGRVPPRRVAGCRCVGFSVTEVRVLGRVPPRSWWAWRNAEVPTNAGAESPHVCADALPRVRSGERLVRSRDATKPGHVARASCSIALIGAGRCRRAPSEVSWLR